MVIAPMAVPTLAPLLARALAALLLLSPAPPVPVPPPPGLQAPSPFRPAAPLATVLVDGYLDRYFATYPTEATAAGRHDFDARLEDLSPVRRVEWQAYNRAMLLRIGE